MLGGLKPYQGYKDSGLPWLGQIPAHWDIRRMKYILREFDLRSVHGKEQLLRVSQYTGVTQRHRADGLEEPDTRAASLVGYKLVSENQLVINIMLAWNGSMGVSHYSGIVSPAYCVYRFVSDASPWFFDNLLRSPAYKARIKSASTGVVESRLRLYSNDLYQIETLLPPPEEQDAIVKFLDYANGKLERAIRAKRRTIALLNEQKQAIIHRAVTRGLDPSAPLKPSGIPWLGDIPKHWSSRKMRNLLTSFNERNRADLPLLSVVREQGVIVRDIDDLDSNHNYIPADLSNYKVVKKAQFVMNKMKAWQGSYGVSQLDGIVSPAYFVFNLHYVVSDFFHLAVRSKAYVPSFTQASDGVRVGQWDLSISKMKEIVFFYPCEDEQKKIVRFINQETKKFSVAISRLEHEITLLQEYRTRLISDVVTGKLDVREAARGLPAQEAVPDLDTDLGADEDDGLEDAA